MSITSTSTKLTASKPELKKALAKMLTNFITAKKWSDKVAAKELEINTSTVTNLSKGVLKNISMDEILDIFGKFGYTNEFKKSSIKDLLDLILTKKHV